MKGLQVLLVEDNEGDVILTKEALVSARFPYTLDVAMDGEKALEMLFQENDHTDYVLPDIILLDINLPKLNGLEVLSRIKKSETLRVIPVIMLTTSDDDRDIIMSYSSYANSYIVKPDRIGSFQEIITCLEDYWGNIVKLANIK